MPPARLASATATAVLLGLSAQFVPAQVIQSQAAAFPQVNFGLFETSPLGPVTLTGSVPALSMLWAPGSTVPYHYQGSQGIALMQAQPSEARIAYDVDAGAAGEDHVLTIDFIALSNPMHWGGAPATGLAEVQGGCVIDLVSAPATAVGVVVTAEIQMGNPGYYANLHVDIGNDGTEELAVESFNGQIASPIDAHGRLELGGGPQRIRIGGIIQALGDNGTSLASIHIVIRVSPGLAALASTVGASCGTSGFTPTLTSLTLPQLDGLFLLSVDNLPLTPTITVGAVGFDSVSYGGAALPLDLGIAGMPGCHLYLAPEGPLFPAIGAGSAVWNIAMPSQFDFVGLPFFVQSFVLAPSANAAGLLATNACSAVIGL